MHWAQVSNNARESLFLRALSKVAATGGGNAFSLNICGGSGSSIGSSCSGMLLAAITRLGWQAAALLAVLLILAPNVVLILLDRLGSFSSAASSSSSGSGGRRRRAHAGMFSDDAEDEEESMMAVQMHLSSASPVPSRGILMHPTFACGSGKAGCNPYYSGDASCCHEEGGGEWVGDGAGGGMLGKAYHRRTTQPPCARRGSSEGGDYSYCQATRMHKADFFNRPISMDAPPHGAHCSGDDED